MAPRLYLVLGLGFVRPTSAAPLPEGNSGIAARYPDDVGIGADPAVIFVDDFESYSGAAGLTSRWNEAWHAPNLRIATEAGNFLAGSKALEVRVPQSSSEVSNNMIKHVSPARDVLFLRHYAKFDGAFNVLGSSHNGMTISSRYCELMVKANTPGQRDGRIAMWLPSTSDVRTRRSVAQRNAY